MDNYDPYKCYYPRDMEYNLYLHCGKYREKSQEFCDVHMNISESTCLYFYWDGFRYQNESIPETRYCQHHQQEAIRREKFPKCQVILSTGEQCYLYPQRSCKDICTYHSTINSHS